MTLLISVVLVLNCMNVRGMKRIRCELLYDDIEIELMFYHERLSTSHLKLSIMYIPSKNFRLFTRNSQHYRIMFSPWEIGISISVQLSSGSKSLTSPSTFHFNVLIADDLRKNCTEKDQML